MFFNFKQLSGQRWIIFQAFYTSDSQEDLDALANQTQRYIQVEQAHGSVDVDALLSARASSFDFLLHLQV